MRNVFWSKALRRSRTSVERVSGSGCSFVQTGKVYVKSAGSIVQEGMVAPVTSVGSPAADPVAKDETALSDVWGVIVLNDPVNLMSYVTMVLERVLRMSKSKAEEHMMEVHQKGRSLVFKGNREKAEGYVYQLQEWHLNAILERDETD